MEGDFYDFHRALRIYQVDRVVLYFGLLIGDVVETHHAIAEAEHATPLGDVEGSHTSALLSSPYLHTSNSNKTQCTIQTFTFC